jgi:hypothetical protein
LLDMYKLTEISDLWHKNPVYIFEIVFLNQTKLEINPS